MIYSKETVQLSLSKNKNIKKVFFFDVVDSTNNFAKKLIQDNPNESLSGTIIITKSQTAGRGRLGRSFFSPTDTGIYLSLIFSTTTQNYENDGTLITPKTAVAVCQTLNKLSNKKFQIKWVNDIYCDNKKVCGILTEGIINSKTKQIDNVIIGIGINTEQTKEQLPTNLESVYGNADLSSIDKTEIISTLMETLFCCLEKTNDNQIMLEYKNNSIVLGKTVNVLEAKETYKAIILDITNKGHLIAQRIDNSNKVELFSGEVSIKL